MEFNNQFLINLTYNYIETIQGFNFLILFTAQKIVDYVSP